jgi:uncharacterized protein
MPMCGTAYGNKAFRRLNDRWYASGLSYENVDTLAGRPNPWLRKWLGHPSYDAYWQSMLPFREELARINIRVADRLRERLRRVHISSIL